MLPVYIQQICFKPRSFRGILPHHRGSLHVGNIVCMFVSDCTIPSLDESGGLFKFLIYLYNIHATQTGSIPEKQFISTCNVIQAEEVVRVQEPGYVYQVSEHDSIISCLEGSRVGNKRRLGRPVGSNYHATSGYVFKTKLTKLKLLGQV